MGKHMVTLLCIQEPVLACFICQASYQCFSAVLEFYCNRVDFASHCQNVFVSVSLEFFEFV